MAAKKSSAKKSSTRARKLKSIPRGPDPFRETIEISRGPNVDGLAHQAAAAHRRHASPATDAEARRNADLAPSAPAAPLTSKATFEDAGKDVAGKEQ